MRRQGAPIDRVLGQLTGVRPSGDGFVALCPAHHDTTPSLSVSQGHDGRVLLHCHAGCSLDAVHAALGLEARDLFPEPSMADESGDDWTPHGPAVASYTYTDEAGRPLFTVCRTANKQFPAWQPDPTKRYGKAWSLAGVRVVPYRLPRVIEAAARGDVVHVVEGEKDVEALEAADCIATCNPGGAGKWKAEYSEYLRGAQVVVIADRDEPGRRHAAQVAGSLTGIAKSVVVVEAKEGKDAADHLTAGYGPHQFVRVELPSEAQVESECDRGYCLAPIDWEALIRSGIPPVEYVFRPYFPKGARIWVWGATGSYKSLYCEWVAAELSRRGVRVAYFSEENPLHEELRRMPRTRFSWTPEGG